MEELQIEEEVKITPAISLAMYSTYCIYNIVFKVENICSQA